MPRANRFFLPGHVWHITHRCHKQEFLLKFARDRKRWLRWLFEAKKRFGLCVLNYIVTSNHIHLLVHDRGEGEIARSMQLVAGRTAQEFDQRKRRKGAYWEDRYHATAVDTRGYLARCLVYIDMNMVRAGVVSHPSGWPEAGYCELMVPPQRYGITDIPTLMNLLGVATVARLQDARAQWVADAVSAEQHRREAMWSTSLAVGSEAFVEDVQSRLGLRVRHREVVAGGDAHCLKEPAVVYSVDFTQKMATLSESIPRVSD
jgi:putative transposase